MKRSYVRTNIFACCLMPCVLRTQPALRIKLKEYGNRGKRELLASPRFA